MGHPATEAQIKRVIAMYARGDALTDIAEAANLTVRGCQKIIARAWTDGDTRAKPRRKARSKSEAGTLRKVQAAHQLRTFSSAKPKSLRNQAMEGPAIAGLDPDFDDGRW